MITIYNMYFRNIFKKTFSTSNKNVSLGRWTIIYEQTIGSKGVLCES